MKFFQSGLQQTGFLLLFVWFFGFFFLFFGLAWLGCQQEKLSTCIEQASSRSSSPLSPPTCLWAPTPLKGERERSKINNKVLGCIQ